MEKVLCMSKKSISSLFDGIIISKSPESKTWFLECPIVVCAAFYSHNAWTNLNQTGHLWHILDTLRNVYLNFLITLWVTAVYFEQIGCSNCDSCGTKLNLSLKMLFCELYVNKSKQKTDYMVGLNI